MTKTFYRLEDNAGVGPYQGASYEPKDSVRSRMLRHHGRDSYKHPTPGDGGYYMHANQVSAFRNMRDLFAWFGGWLPALIREGYRVVTVSGIAKYDDGRQVVIEKR